MPRGRRRAFPPDFKAKVVLELLAGTASQADLCRKYNLKPQLLAGWKGAVLERLHTLFQDDATKRLPGLQNQRYLTGPDLSAQKYRS
jgi:transposase-like protein